MSLLKLLAQDKNTITYRKELNSITGGVTATILLQQLIYWFNKSDNKPFYKFIEPCNNEKYTDGDSWTEELGFTKREFTSAYKKLEDLEVVSKQKNMMNVTFYSLNLVVLAKLLNAIYGSDNMSFPREQNVTSGSDNMSSTDGTNCHLVYSKSFDSETTTETTTDNNLSISFFFSENQCCGKNHTCKRKSAMTIDNEYFCSQHGRLKLSKLGRLDLIGEEEKKSLKSQTEEKIEDSGEQINKQALSEWLDYKNYKNIAPITKTINFLTKYDFVTQQQIVDSSIMNGYKGLFEPKQQQQPYNTPKYQTLNTDVNVWDMIEEQSQREQGAING